MCHFQMEALRTGVRVSLSCLISGGGMHLDRALISHVPSGHDAGVRWTRSVSERQTWGTVFYAA